MFFSPWIREKPITVAFVVCFLREPQQPFDAARNAHSWIPYLDLWTGSLWGRAYRLGTGAFQEILMHARSRTTDASCRPHAGFSIYERKKVTAYLQSAHIGKGWTGRETGRTRVIQCLSTEAIWDFSDSFQMGLILFLWWGQFLGRV